MVNLQNYENTRIIKLKKSEDLFIILRKIFVDYSYTKIGKSVNIFCLVFHFLVLLLQFCYVIQHFDLELIVRYGPNIAVIIYIIAAMAYSIILKSKIISNLDLLFSISWSVKNVSIEKRRAISNKSKLFYNSFLVTITVFIVISIIFTPIFGDMSDICFSKQTFEKYLPTWSKILSFVYFSTMPFLFYSVYRLCCNLLYGILSLRLQISLLNERVSQISKTFNHISEEKKYTNRSYQRMVSKELKLCIDQHCALKKWLRSLLDMVQPCMPVFIILGTLNLIAIIVTLTSDIWNNLNYYSLNMLIRFSLLTLTCILSTFFFTEGGERLIQETGLIFDELSNCFWYIWNKENKQILLVFMANTLKPLEFSFAGIVLNRTLTLSMLNKAVSVALFFYSIKDL